MYSNIIEHTVKEDDNLTFIEPTGWPTFYLEDDENNIFKTPNNTVISFPTRKLAELIKFDLYTKLTSENFNFINNEKFDVIYVGNCFHHSEIEKSINEIKKHLSNDGILVSWDPMAYNPIINIYRKIATKVRTIDEHPLTLKDLSLFKKNFSNIEIEYFWFTTLLIFCLMFIFQRKNPNKERYWKSIIYDHKKWLWLYYPLEKIDKLILKIFPFLKFLCWNVAIFARK